MTVAVRFSAEPETVRRATAEDTERIARLFAAAFHSDPVFNWLLRDGPQRMRALQRFFSWAVQRRTMPHGETWISANRLAAAAWIPPYSTAQPRLADDLRMLPIVLRLTGLQRLARGAALAAAMEETRPRERHFYLAFLGVAPRLQGSGWGSALLERTLARIDATGANAYLDNSNPRNLPLYQRYGFEVVGEVIARSDAPPLYAMWRPARGRKSDADQGSSTISQYK